MARDLLGKLLVRHYRGGRLVGRIVETEAYCENDPASHSYRGKTRRNDVMFREGGHLYVYFTYGMHFCANVVTRGEGIGEAVLIRAVEPVEGIESMLQRRKPGGNNRAVLTNGPAKLCEAFAIERKENGTDLVGDEIYLLDSPRLPSLKVVSSARIGIKNGKEKKWRFYIKGSAWVSR